MKRVEKFLTQGVCPDCGGTRLSERARSSRLLGITLADAAAMTLDALIVWVKSVPAAMPDDMRDMAESICGQFLHTARRLIELGLGYLTLDRAGATLSTGERQRVQLARAVRNRTTGVLYVLDEPSIGLHPANVDGLLGVVNDLVERGNSVVLVDHDVRVLRAADHLVEMGKFAGAEGGRVLAEGTVEEVAADPNSLIAGFLSDRENTVVRERADADKMFEEGHIRLSVKPLHTVRELDLDIPKGRLIAVTGVSGSGKTTLILESLLPALKARSGGEKMPAHIKSLDAQGITRANLIDASPIGVNVRSTVATYSGVLDDLRKLYAGTPDAKAQGVKAGDLSYNTGSMRCEGCDGTGQITMDIQFLPDVEIVCPDCGGSRYGKAAYSITYSPKKGAGITLPELMSLTVDQAAERLSGSKKIRERLQVLRDLGLGYLTLGEATPRSRAAKRSV